MICNLVVTGTTISSLSTKSIYLDPAISFVLPVHNAEKTLGQAIQSILCQRYPSFEVIAVDDGSTDATPDILRTYSARDPRIRPVFCHKNGLIETLNKGLSLSKGTFVARMDADDICHPDRIGIQLQFMMSNPEISVLGTQIRCFPLPDVGEGFRIYESWINALLSPGDIGREIFIESPLVHPTAFIRKSALDEVGGYEDNGWAEDYDLWLRLYTNHKQFAKIPRILFSWREGRDRLTRTDSRYSVENFLKAKAHYLKLGPLKKSPNVIIWGAGQIGRRISKHLLREGVALNTFVDIDPKKIGSSRRGAPIVSPDELPSVWRAAGRPLVLAAVPSRGARELIRNHLNRLGLKEGEHFICVA